MSERHPIIAVTGSSGAGTSTVTRTFSNIFRREGVKAAIIEGDSLHRYDRKEMKARAAEAERQGNKHFSHFSADNNLFGEIENLFKTYSETGQGQSRKYLHNTEEAAPYQQPAPPALPWPLPVTACRRGVGAQGDCVADQVGRAVTPVTHAESAL